MPSGVRRLMLVLVSATACGPKPAADGQTKPPEAAARDPLAIYEALEAKIAEGKDSEQDRSDALSEASGIADDQSAAYAFVRAALAGRVAENRGAKAGKLVTESEGWAMKSIERDPEFRDRAATQLLGSLYVMAPGRLVEHGDSEKGLEMLEKLVASKPDEPRYRLRLAQAYVHLGDDEPAHEHACASLAGRAKLRGDEQKLLDALVTELGGAEALACGG
jgi:hypothetical protein